MDDVEPKEDLVILKGNEERVLSSLTRRTYVIYANDSIILPVFKDTYVYRNPDFTVCIARR